MQKKVVIFILQNLKINKLAYFLFYTGYVQVVYTALPTVPTCFLHILRLRFFIASTPELARGRSRGRGRGRGRGNALIARTMQVGILLMRLINFSHCFPLL